MRDGNKPGELELLMLALIDGHLLDVVVYDRKDGKLKEVQDTKISEGKLQLIVDK